MLAPLPDGDGLLDRLLVLLLDSLLALVANIGQGDRVQGGGLWALAKKALASSSVPAPSAIASNFPIFSMLMVCVSFPGWLSF